MGPELESLFETQPEPVMASVQGGCQGLPRSADGPQILLEADGHSSCCLFRAMLYNDVFTLKFMHSLVQKHSLVWYGYLPRAIYS